jgi:hypothetical protein
MPYAVKTFPATDAAVILCKDERELAKVNAATLYGLGYSASEAVCFTLESAIWLASDAPTFSRLLITIYRLTEEEYDKWKKAF